MNSDISQLTELFQQLTIQDNRINKQQSEEDILIRLFDQLTINDDNDNNMNSIIDKMEKLSINDDDVVIVMKDKTIITIRYNNCTIDYLQQQTHNLPMWTQAF